MREERWREGEGTDEVYIHLLLYMYYSVCLQNKNSHRQLLIGECYITF